MLTNPGGEFSTLLSLVLVCFTVGSETGPPRSYVGLLLVLVPFVGVSIAHDLEPSDLAAALVFFVGPWTVGGWSGAASTAATRRSPGPSGWSASGSWRRHALRRRSAPGSPASCTTSCPTRSAW